MSKFNKDKVLPRYMAIAGLLTVVGLDSVWLVLIAAAFGILVGRWKKA